jgi:hypothetical protein
VNRKRVSPKNWSDETASHAIDGGPRRARTELANLRGDTCVYFVRAPKAGAIKIGVTRQLKRRLNELQIANPYELRLLGIINGGFPTERVLAERFHPWHMRGEWYDEEILLDVLALTKEDAEFYSAA